MTVTIPPIDEIDSTFEHVGPDGSEVSSFNDPIDYRGTHVYDGDVRVGVTREFLVDTEFDPGRLRILSIYHDENGAEIKRSKNIEQLGSDPETGEANTHVSGSGETIEQYCRSDHYFDPQLDIEIAVGALKERDESQ
jgi:hypothetical protein